MKILRLIFSAAIGFTVFSAAAQSEARIINSLVYSPELEQIAESGHPVAQNNLGIVYQQGSGVDCDLQKAVYWFERAANAGNGRAMSNLGAAYLNGTGVERDPVQAFEWFEKSAQTGEGSGYFNLATLYYRGVGVEKDWDKALRYAHYSLDAETSETFTDKDITHRTINVGKGKTLMFLAMCYAKGVGTVPDSEKAFEYTRQAAGWGNPEASLSMSQAYENGRGVEKNLAMAEQCYRNAADGGYAQAQYILGSRYYSGELFARNDELAEEYLALTVANKQALPAVIKADAMLKLADLAERRGDNARADGLRQEASSLPTPAPETIRAILFDE